MSQRVCMCFILCVLVCHVLAYCKRPSQGETTFTYALGQLSAFLNPGASCGHFLSCFGAQKTMLFPQEAGHPLSFPPAPSSPHHLSGPWDHGHYDCNNYSGRRGSEYCDLILLTVGLLSFLSLRDGTHCD